MAHKKRWYEVYTKDKRSFWRHRAYNMEDAARLAGFKPSAIGRSIVVEKIKGKP